MANLFINNGGIITNKEGMPSIDLRYGPYASLSAAHAALSADGLCTIGLTVGIINDNKVEEYWYQEGTAQANLVKKVLGKENDAVSFDGFIPLEPVTIIEGSTFEPDAILYSRNVNRFVAKKGNKYYDNWEERGLYNNGNAPYTSKIYPYNGKSYTWNGTTFEAESAEAVKYNAQTLTAQQKKQAAQNIGLDVVVKGDVQQSLSDAQRVQAQNNMMGKAYSSVAADHSGLGKVYLDKNNGVLTQSMMQATNTVYVIQYDYTLGEDITVPANCVLEFEGGSINGGKINGTTLSIYGNVATLKNIKIRIDGDKNVIKDIIICNEQKPSSDHTIYYNAGLIVSGNYNFIENVESYNQDGPGINVNGIGNKINEVYCHDNSIGLLVGANTRSITITNSKFTNNDVSTTSGSDGILFLRTVIGVTIDNCDLSYNGEHGIYFQGQNATITNNRVFGNNKNGLKFGSYDDDGYAYEGETLDCWVPGYEGVPGYNGVAGANGWGMKNIIIANNTIGTQLGDANGGIYFQPSVCNLTISDNVLKDTNIDINYFNYGGARLELMKDIYIHDNIIENGNMSVSSIDNTVIENNKVVDIYTTCQDANVPPMMSNMATNVIIDSNNCEGRIAPMRSSSAVIKNNTCANITSSDSQRDVIIQNNKITAFTGMFNTVADFSFNTVTVAENASFLLKTSVRKNQLPPVFRYNNITFGVAVGDYFIDHDNRSDIIMEGNTITGSSYYIICVKNSSNCKIVNNRIINRRTSGRGIKFEGTSNNHIIIGNTIISDTSQYSRSQTPSSIFAYNISGSEIGTDVILTDYMDAVVGTPTYGTFAEKPTTTNNKISVGFKYFCTDKQTTEGATNGIEIIHKGNNVWVDALGRVVS